MPDRAKTVARHKRCGGAILHVVQFNQPSSISAPSFNSSSAFYYDENLQRFEQLASYSGSSESTEYIGGLMEKMINAAGTAYRYYVPAGSNFIVYNRWLSGTNTISYATKDNIDSTAVITDSKGALVVAEKYAALGWGGGGAMGASVTRHEFTGQEGLDNSGLWLVDMNGRIYNSSGAYFYSPDPKIPDRENTLDYNRYAYVDDNPLTFNDPSGFDANCQITGSGCGGGSPQTGPTAPQQTNSASPSQLPEVDVSGSRIDDIANLAAYIDWQSAQLQKTLNSPLSFRGLGERMTSVLQQSNLPQQTKPTQQPQCPNGSQPSMQNNSHVSRNVLGGMFAFGSIGAAIYTVVAVTNLEDGGGEVMLGLRAAQLARSGETMVNAADATMAVARMGGVSDAALAGANGAAAFSPLGAAAGAALTTATCANK